MLKIFIIAVLVGIAAAAAATDDASYKSSLVVRRERRESIAQTEYGTISAVDIDDGIKGPYHLQFFTLDPNSLLLPVLLHADMVFYVQSGSGSLSWTNEDGTNQIDVSKGDIYRIPAGSVFFVKSNLEAERERLRICSIFTDPISMEFSHELFAGAYSTMPDLISGFDTKVLQAAFQVSEDVIASIRNSTKSPPIVHVPSANKTEHTNWPERILEFLTGGGLDSISNKKKKKTKIFNILNTKPDFQNCNGWSKTVNRKDLKALRGSNIGVFMVNLTEGSMMGPHWNPRASELTLVLHGQGMVHIVCSSMMNETGCKNRRFKVKEGDVFAVPRFHPMAQMAYNNETFVFMGFSTMARLNYPQFLAGKSSVLQTLDKNVLAMAFNVSNATVTELLSAQGDSVILGCVSCAEEEEMRMQEEIKKERQKEEAKKKREEEERKRKEEERRKREEEERKRREEEERKQREEEEEEERKRQEEEERRREEEEERKRQEEEERRREEEEAAEEARRREEEEERKRHEEEAAQREAEKEAQRKQQEEEERRREEEAAAEAQRKQQEEEERRREEEEAEAEAQREQQEAEEQRREEAEAQRREQEEEQRREEVARQEQEEAARQEQEREERRRQEEEAQREQQGQGRGDEPGWGRKEGRREGGGGGGFRKIFIF